MTNDPRTTDTMTTNRWTAIAAGCGVAGGLCWLLKIATIAAAGASGGVDVPLFFAGLVLLLLGASGLGVWLARSRSTALRVVAAVLVPAVALGLFVLVQIVTEPLGGLLPDHLSAEYGIALAAVVGLVLGIWRLRRPRADSSAASGSAV